jgi:hypothetical protein
MALTGVLGFVESGSTRVGNPMGALPPLFVRRIDWFNPALCKEGFPRCLAKAGRIVKRQWLRRPSEAIEAGFVSPVHFIFLSGVTVCIALPAFTTISIGAR